MRVTHFNHLDLTSSELTFPQILTHNCHFYSHFLRAGQQKIGTQRKLVRSNPQSDHPHDIAPPPHRPNIFLQGKQHTRITPFRVATHCWMNVSLEFCKMHSPCSYFAISPMIEGGEENFRGGGGGGGFRFLLPMGRQQRQWSCRCCPLP